MNKKADLTLTEGAKLMLAVICIGLLVLFAVMLYNSLTNKQEREQAQATLEQLVGQIEALKEGEVTEFLITAPSSWFLVSFDDKLADRPKACPQNKFCLCMCEGADPIDAKKRVESCSKNVACKTASSNILVDRLVNFYTEEKESGKLYDTDKKIIEKARKIPIVVYLWKDIGQALITHGADIKIENARNSLYKHIEAEKKWLEQNPIRAGEEIRVFIDGTEYIKNKEYDGIIREIKLGIFLEPSLPFFYINKEKYNIPSQKIAIVYKCKEGFSYSSDALTLRIHYIEQTKILPDKEGELDISTILKSYIANKKMPETGLVYFNLKCIKSNTAELRIGVESRLT